LGLAKLPFIRLITRREREREKGETPSRAFMIYCTFYANWFGGALGAL